jgi:hypothetical protein
MGATTQPTTQVPVAPAGPSPDVVKEAMRQRDLNTVQANRSTADVIKEIQAERDASGIGDNKAREEYRAQQMAERANMADEKSVNVTCVWLSSLLHGDRLLAQCLLLV